MLKNILNQFFQSNIFWSQFVLVKEFSREYSYYCHYHYKTEFKDIILKFAEIQGVKSLTVISNKKGIVEHIYFLNIDELTLILNRIGEIRAANPLCSGSLSIKALSCSH